jgi:hypothetical protein
MRRWTTNPPFVNIVASHRERERERVPPFAKKIYNKQPWQEPFQSLPGQSLCPTYGWDLRIHTTRVFRFEIIQRGILVLVLHDHIDSEACFSFGFVDFATAESQGDEEAWGFLDEGVLEETEGFGGSGGEESNRHGNTVRGERRKKKCEEEERSERRENVSVFLRL